MGLETLLAASAITQAAGGIGGGIAGMQAGSYNAAVAEREAELARQTAAIEADRVRRAGRKLVGTQRVAAAASGVDVSGGSPLLVMLDTIRQTAEDASLATWKGEVKATGLEAEARAQRRAGRQALIGGLFKAGKAGAQYGLRRELFKSGGITAATNVAPYAGGYD